MALSDPLGDMLTRIRNGQRAMKSAVKSPASNLRCNVLDTLKREGYIRGYENQRSKPVKVRLRSSLNITRARPLLNMSAGCPSLGVGSMQA